MARWLESEIDILRNHCNCLSKEQLLNILPHRTWISIKRKALRLNLNMKSLNYWSDKEIQILKEKYSILSKKEILSLFPNRSWISINHKVKNIGIKKRNFVKFIDLSKLLDNNVKSFYWMGFLLADGHFSSRNGIRLAIKKSDESHFQSYANFINYKKNIKSYKNGIEFNSEDLCSITASDTILVPKIKNKFFISNRKTYNPPDLKKIRNLYNDELFFSLIIGFIDGDGSITKKKNGNSIILKIGCHSNWLDNLILIFSFLHDYFNVEITSNVPEIDSSGFAVLRILKYPLLQEIKKKCIELKIPFMKRKWNKIDENKDRKNMSWTQNEISSLTNNYKKINIKELSDLYGRSDNSIRMAISKFIANV